MSPAQPARAHLDSGPRPLMLPAHNEPQGPRGHGPQPTPCGHHPQLQQPDTERYTLLGPTDPETSNLMWALVPPAAPGSGPSPPAHSPPEGAAFPSPPPWPGSSTPRHQPPTSEPPGQTGQSLSALSCPIRDAPHSPLTKPTKPSTQAGSLPAQSCPSRRPGMASRVGAGGSPRLGQPPLPGEPPCGPSWAGAALRGPPSPPRVQGQCRSLPGGSATPNTHRLSTGTPFTACDRTGSPTCLPPPSARWRSTTAPTDAGRSWCPGSSPTEVQERWGASVPAPHSEFYSHSGAVSPPPRSQLPPAPASSIPGRRPGGTGHLTADGPQDRARGWMCRRGPSQEDR